jgi:hypothetical protein
MGDQQQVLLGVKLILVNYKGGEAAGTSPTAHYEKNNRLYLGFALLARISINSNFEYNM